MKVQLSVAIATCVPVLQPDIQHTPPSGLCVIPPSLPSSHLLNRMNSNKEKGKK